MKWICVFCLSYVAIINPMLCEAGFITRPPEGTFDYVKTVDDIPEGHCCYVLRAPRPIDHLRYPTPPLLCRTQGVVLLPYLEDYRTDELK